MPGACQCDTDVWEGGRSEQDGGMSRAESQPRSSHAVSEKDSEETVVDVGGVGEGGMTREGGGASGDRDFAK